MTSLDANLLIADIASGDNERRRQATDIIAEIDHDTDVDVSVFVSSLASTHDDVVFWSAIALEHLGERGSAGIPHLLTLLQREQLFLRQSAVKTLLLLDQEIQKQGGQCSALLQILARSFAERRCRHA